MTPYYVAFASLGLIGIVGIGFRFRVVTQVMTLLGTLVLWILLALRATHIGIDVPAYLTGLRLAGNVPILAGEQIFNFEVGFSIYLVLLARADASDQVFLALTAALTLIPVGLTIARFSKMPMLSLFLYATLGMYTLAFSGLRQAWAVALCFAAFGAIRDRHIWRFLAFVGIASLLHLSALVFLPAYWIYRVRIRQLQLLLGLVLVALVWMFRVPVYGALYQLYRGREVTVDTTGALSFFIALLLVWVAALILDPPTGRDEEADPDLAGTRNYIYLAALFQCLASVSFLIGRVGQYYLIFAVLLVPLLIERQRDPATKFFLVVGACLTGLIYFSVQADAFAIAPYSTFAR